MLYQVIGVMCFCQENPSPIAFLLGGSCENYRVCCCSFDFKNFVVEVNPQSCVVFKFNNHSRLYFQASLHVCIASNNIIHRTLWVRSEEHTSELQSRPHLV